MKYTYYRIDNTKVTIERETVFSLEELQELVGGNIEGLALNDGTYIFFNEEGLLDDLPVNPFWPEDHPLIAMIMTEGGIRGNVIQGKTDGDGEFIGL